MAGGRDLHALSRALCAHDSPDGGSAGGFAQRQQGAPHLPHHRSGVRYAASAERLSGAAQGRSHRALAVSYRDKKEIANLGIHSLKLAAVEKPLELREQADDLFIHATIFVLVDKQARLRGIFETGGEGVEWTNVQPAIISAIRQLEQER